MRVLRGIVAQHKAPRGRFARARELVLHHVDGVLKQYAAACNNYEN